MPYVLYLRCIMAFAEKYTEIYSPVNVYNVLRLGTELDISMVMTVNNLVRLIDHVALDMIDNMSDDLSQYDPSLLSGLNSLVSGSQSGDQILGAHLYDFLSGHGNDDAVVQCLHRFASRCIAARMLDLLMHLFSEALHERPCKEIRQILYSYGAHIDVNDYRIFETACACGMAGVIERLVSSHQADTADIVHYLALAMQSGDADIMRLVAALLPPVIDGVCYVDARDFDVSYCELLLSLGVIGLNVSEHRCYLVVGQNEPRYELFFFNVCSIDVMKWMLQHNAINVRNAIHDVVCHAIVYGEPYIEILHYLVEDVHISMPSNVHYPMRQCDLGVVNYITAHDDHRHPVTTSENSLLIRYWLDCGAEINQRKAWSIVSYYIHSNAPANLLDVMIVTTCCNINEPFGYDGDTFEFDITLLLYACRRRNAVAVQVLLKHGANVNAKSWLYSFGYTPLRYTCIDNNVEILKILLNHGVDEYIDITMA